MRVLTWNILYEDDYTTRLPQILAAIDDQKADIVCLQEVALSTFESDFACWNDAFHQVCQTSKKRLRAIEKWNSQGLCPSGMVCVVLVRKDFGQLTNVHSGSRTLTATVVPTNASIPPFTITTLHLEARERDIHRTHITRPEVQSSLIVCGDFNVNSMESEEFHSVDFLTSGVFQSHQSLVTYKDTRHGRNVERSLDYLLLRQNSSWTYKSLYTTPQFSGLTSSHPSDHAYVVADFDYIDKK